MSKALFVTVKDLKEKSIISGSTDGDKLIHFIELAQDMHIQNYLGGKLYDKLQVLILSGEIDDTGNAVYKTLRDNYIKPMLIWFTQVEYFPFSMYKIDNGGLSKHRGENEDTIDYTDVDRMQSKLRERAGFYTKRFIDYMCYNSNDYPEYTQNKEDDMYPDRDNDSFSSFVL